MAKLELVEGRSQSGLQSLADAPGEVLDAVPAGIYVVDREGFLVRFNARAAQIWGRVPSIGDHTERFCGVYRAYRADGGECPISEVPMAEVLQTGKSVRDRELEIEQPGGERRVLLVTIDPLHDPDGSLIGAINCFQDITARARAEHELRRSRQDLEDFFDNGAVGLHLVAFDGTILKANQAELELLGYSADEYIGRSIRDIHADEEVIADILQRLSAGERLDKYPARLRAKDGSIRHVLITSNVNFQDGAFQNTRCFTIDVTDWRRAEEKREATERRMVATVEAAPVGIGETDAKGRYLATNPAFTELTGYSAAELAGLTFLDITHPDDRGADWNQYLDQIAGELDIYVVEKRYIRKDGREIIVQVSSSAVRCPDGSFDHGVRIVQDVTARRLAEAQVAASERRSRELLEGLPIAIYTTDTQGRITFFNQAAVEFSGRSPVIGSDSWCVSWRLYESDGTPLPHERCPMALTLRNGHELRGAVALAERPDGTRIPFMPFPKLLRDEAGNVTGAINMLVDLSDRFRAEEEQRVLIDELNHRVKNTLATVHSLAKRTMRSTPDAFMENFEPRLMALSHAHELLSRRRWSRVGLSELLDIQLSPFGSRTDRITTSGPEVTLTARTGLLFGMLLHELATNAIKHGALSSNGGRVILRWDVQRSKDSTPCLTVEWLEEGGPPVAPAPKRGFGTTLLERSVRNDLSGSIDLQFAPGGLECQIVLPVD